MGARWLWCAVVLVVLAAACGGDSPLDAGPEPASPTPAPVSGSPGGPVPVDPQSMSGSDDASAAEADGDSVSIDPQPASDSEGAAVSEDDAVPVSASGELGFDAFVTPSVSGLDLERLAAAVATLDPDAVCPVVDVPASFEGVVEVGRIAGGCAVVEYVALDARSVDEVRAEFASDPTVFAVGLPAVDLQLNRVSQRSDVASYPQWHLAKMGVDQLWLAEGWTTSDGRHVPGWPDGKEIIVAVIDSGVDATHRDLGVNVLDVGNDCHRTPNGDHGTHVAGIIAAVLGNGVDVAGIAPKAKILPIKVHYADHFDTKNNPDDPDCYAQVPTVTMAILHARSRGADVINMSFDWSYDPTSVSLADQALIDDFGPQVEPLQVGEDVAEWAIRVVLMEKIAVVAGAGNCGGTGWQKESCTAPNQRRGPALYPGVIAVAATDLGDIRASFSTVNEDVDIAAPGVRILSTVPPYVATATAACGAGQTCHVEYYNGTSMAAPMVAAVAAHMKARYPQATPGLIRDALFETAVPPIPYRHGVKNSRYGWGIVDPVAALEWLENRLGESTPPSPPTTTTIPPPPTTTPSPTAAPNSVTLTPGSSAQGFEGCSSEHCKHLSISLDAPAGEYDVECWSSRDPEPWYAGTWSWPHICPVDRRRLLVRLPRRTSLGHRQRHQVKRHHVARRYTHHKHIADHD